MSARLHTEVITCEEVGASKLILVFRCLRGAGEDVLFRPI